MIYIPDPWIPNREGGASILHLTRWGEEPKQIEVTSFRLALRSRGRHRRGEPGEPPGPSRPR